MRLHHPAGTLAADGFDVHLTPEVAGWGFSGLEVLTLGAGDTREITLDGVEAMVLLAVAYRRERHAEKAVPLLNKLIEMFPRHYLYRLEMVQMYADQGKKDEALAVLKTMEDLRSAGALGYKNLPGGKIYYSRGNLLFWYREYAGAIPDLKRVIAAGPEAGLNTLMNAWLRLGQCQDMLGRRNEALQAYRQAIDGAPDSDAAREARRYLSTPYRRAVF